MSGFWFHHFWLRRLYIKGGGLRAMRAKLERERRVNRRLMQSVMTSQVAAAEMQEQNRRIGEVMDLRRVANALDELWVIDCLFEIENDPLMRIVWPRNNSQNLGSRNTMRVNRARTFTGRRRRPGPP